MMKSSALAILNFLLGSNNLNILQNTSGLRLIGSMELSPTRIILLEVSKHFEHHDINFGTLKNSGMQPTFTNPTVLRCFGDISSAHKSEYQ